jgi:hypothetical protein
MKPLFYLKFLNVSDEGLASKIHRSAYNSKIRKYLNLKKKTKQTKALNNTFPVKKTFKWKIST